MELSITAIVAIIGISLTILTIFAGIVGGFVRMESKSNQHTSDIADLYNKVEGHLTDRTLHHDAEELNRRFEDIRDGMADIKSEIKTGISGLSRRIDDLIKSK